MVRFRLLNNKYVLVVVGLLFGVLTYFLIFQILFPPLPPKVLTKIADAPLPPLTSVDNTTQHLVYLISDNQPTDGLSPKRQVEVWMELGSHGLAQKFLQVMTDVQTKQLLTDRWSIDTTKDFYEYQSGQNKICHSPQSTDQPMWFNNPFLTPVNQNLFFRSSFIENKNILSTDITYQGQAAKQLILPNDSTNQAILTVEPKTMMLLKYVTQTKSKKDQTWQTQETADLIKRETIATQSASIYIPSPMPDAPISDCAS